jgi:hypothetical protein
MSSARSRKGGTWIVTTLSLYRRSSLNRPFMLSSSSDLFVAPTIRASAAQLFDFPKDEKRRLLVREVDQLALWEIAQ